jgi:tRNA threonylcarbamoyladenosine biosynthesis protein TsaB
MRLAIDTSTAACAVALQLPDGSCVERRPGPQRLRVQPAHTQELLPAVAAVLADAGSGFGDISSVAVGIGPGAFTGLRIGVATARAIASARRLAIIPVSSLAALARGADIADDDVVLAVTDARRNEYYCAVYGGDGATMVADRVCGAFELVEIAAQAVASYGHLLALGDAVPALRGELAAIGAEVPGEDDPRHVVSASSIVRLSARSAPVPVGDVVPNYIRPPDAKQSTRESWVAAITGPEGSRS